MIRRPTRNARRRRAFTLIEMMVAMSAGAIVLSAAYFISGRSASAFSNQMSLADTQMSLRMAMEQVRRDFSRAGYLGSRDSTLLLNNCGVPTSTINAITAANVALNGSVDADLTALLNQANPETATTNLTRADMVTLQGAYAAPAMFPVSNTGAVPDNVIQVDRSITTFNMVFSDAPLGGAAGVYNPARFNAVFAPNRGVRFESDGRFYFRLITASNGAANPPTITLDANLPNIGCAPRAGAFVAPLSMIRYAMEPVTAAVASTDADLRALMPSDATLMNAQRPVLVRRELTYPGGGAVDPATTSVVLDNAVEFQVNAIVNPVAPPGLPAFNQLVGGPTVANAAQLRALIVTLSARSMEADRTSQHMPRGLLTLPMRTFIGRETTAGLFYVSRVRTMRAEIFLPNTVNP